MLTLSIAAWWNNKRVDDLRGDMKDLKGDMRELRGDMNRRFDRLKVIVSNHGERIFRLEERMSPLARER